MTFFLTDVMKMGYSEDKIFAVFHESERDRKRRRVLAKVNETVVAHRLQQIKYLQALDREASDLEEDEGFRSSYGWRR